MEIKTRYARDLGLLEKYQLSRHANGTKMGASITGKFLHPPRQGGMTDRFAYTTLLAPAIIRLLNRHPILSVVLRDIGSPKVHFEFLSHIDLYNVIRFSDHNPDRGADQMMYVPWEFGFDFNSVHPFWNITISPINVQSCYITLAVHHIISDNMGVSTFWNEFIKDVFAPFVEETFKEIEEKLQKDENHYFVQLAPDMILEEPYEKSGAPEPSFFTDTFPLAFDVISSEILPRSVSKFINPSVASWKGESIKVTSPSYYPDVRVFSVDYSDWERVASKASDNKVSEDAIVFVSALLAWAQVYPDDGSVVETIKEVDCRLSCHPPVSDTQIGNFTGIHSTFWTNDAKLRDYQKNPWALAKKYSQDLEKNKLDVAKQILLLKHLPEYPTKYHEVMNFKIQGFDIDRHAGIELADLGRLPPVASNVGWWEMKEVYFCQKFRFCESPFTINTVNVNDNLYCTLVSEKSTLKEENVDKLITAFKDVIKSFLEN